METDIVSIQKTRNLCPVLYAVHVSIEKISIKALVNLSHFWRLFPTHAKKVVGDESSSTQPMHVLYVTCAMCEERYVASIQSGLTRICRVYLQLSAPAF